MFDVKEEKQCTRIIINKQIKSIDEIIKLDSSVIKIIENLKKESLIIGLSYCKELPSSVLGFFVNWERKIKEMGKELVLLDPPDSLMDLIEICDLNSFITVRKS
ncbi:MAG: hypothetical protein ABIA63_01060 [bacterium]